MTASINDLITRTRNGARPTATTVTSTRAVAGTTLACGSLAGWPTASAVHFVTYQTNTSGDVVVGTQCDWKGIVSGSNITNLTLKDGTDAGNAIGDVVEMLPTAAWGEDLAEGLELEHNRDGTHNNTIVAKLAGTQTFTGDKTFSGALTASGAVTLPNNSITANELSASAITLGYAQNTANVTTTNSTPTFATGLTVPVTIPAGGRRVKVTVYTPSLTNGNANRSSFLYLYSGASSGTLTTQLQTADKSNSNAGANDACTLIYVSNTPPSAGAITYNVAFSTDGAGTCFLNAGASAPAFILVELI